MNTLRPADASTKLLKRSTFIAPAPHTRVPVEMYQDLRAWMIDNDPDAAEILNWSADIKAYDTPEDLAGDIIWIILCAGRSAQAARTIERKVWGAIEGGRPVVEVFGYRAKAAAMERAWNERASDFAAFLAVNATGDIDQLTAWCHSIPFIGDDTQFQLAKNAGADLCKPDIWLCRLAGLPDKPKRATQWRFAACMALCKPLATATGDRIAAVDSLLWLACNKRVLQVDNLGGPVRFNRRMIKAAAIMAG